LEDESFQIEKEKNTTLLAIKDDPDLMIESSSSDDDSDIDDGENNPNRFRGELIVSDSDD